MERIRVRKPVRARRSDQEPTPEPRRMERTKRVLRKALEFMRDMDDRIDVDSL